MIHNSIEFSVLVKGRPITEYHHRGQVFIEGRAGSNYEIELRNKSGQRAEVVLSIDGLSVIDGKAAGSLSRGYIIDPHSTITVPGWILDNEKGAKFAFTGKGESYATQATGGDTRNNGVIGIMAFAEKVTYVAPPVYPPVAFPGYYPTPLGSGGFGGVRGIAPNYEVKTSGGRIYGSGASPNNVHYGSVCNDAVLMNVNVSGSSSQFATQSMNATSLNESVSAGSEALSPFNIPNYYSGNNATAPAPTPPVAKAAINTLGTAFGEITEFATHKVSFNRGDMISMMMLYYDEARGLKARGVRIERPSKKKKYQEQPNAFPGMQEGCKPPPGWRG